MISQIRDVFDFTDCVLGDIVCGIIYVELIYALEIVNFQTVRFSNRKFVNSGLQARLYQDAMSRELEYTVTRGAIASDIDVSDGYAMERVDIQVYSTAFL